MASAACSASLVCHGFGSSAPNSASSPSPMNLARWPRCAATACAMRSKCAFSSATRAVGSMRLREGRESQQVGEEDRHLLRLARRRDAVGDDALHHLVGRELGEGVLEGLQVLRRAARDGAPRRPPGDACATPTPRSRRRRRAPAPSARLDEDRQPDDGVGERRDAHGLDHLGKLQVTGQLASALLDDRRAIPHGLAHPRHETRFRASSAAEPRLRRMSSMSAGARRSCARPDRASRSTRSHPSARATTASMRSLVRRGRTADASASSMICRAVAASGASPSTATAAAQGPSWGGGCTGAARLTPTRRAMNGRTNRASGLSTQRSKGSGGSAKNVETRFG